MGLFGFLGGGSGGFKKHAGRVAAKRAHELDRWESIQALGRFKTPEAIAALLVRFNYRIDPTIRDEEEKDAVFRLVTEAGPGAIAPVRAHLASAESISWPLKILEKLVSPEEVVGVLLDVLRSMDTEYERDPERKIQVISYLSDRKDPRIAPAVVRFLEDMNETVRFQTVAALYAQGPDVGIEGGVEPLRKKLLDAFLVEESVRVRASILDGFVDRGWDLGGKADEVRRKLPSKYALDAKGLPRRARRGRS